MDPLAIAASGVRSAELSLFASAHNVANSATASFRPLRVDQASVEGGGSVAHLRQAPHGQEVDLARELIGQARAASQLRASLGVFAMASDTRGHLVDLLA